MKTRIITAAVALALFVTILIAPPAVFTIALAAVIFMMLLECYTATKADTATKAVGFVSAALIMAAAGLIKVFPVLIVMTGVLAAIILSILMYMALVIAKHGKRDYKDVLSSGFLTFYIVLAMSCVWVMREKYTTTLMVMIFVCAWSCDTFAYFTGRFFGKRKLIPNVSPNKTVAGSIGGVFGAFLGCLICLIVSSMIEGASFAAIGKWLPMYLILALIYGVIGGVCSQIGDLTASAIKRDAGIKDFGWIFPGHGGFMDRFDSVIFIAPIIFAITVLWQGI